MQRRLLKSLSPGTVFTTVLEAKEFAEQLPRRINRVLESLASSQLKLKVELIDEGAVIDGLQKVANRITMGLVLAALIIGAAMMMRIESRFTLLGYPGFPTVLLLVAGSLGRWLVLNIVTHDRVARSKRDPETAIRSPLSSALIMAEVVSGRRCDPFSPRFS